MASLSQFLSLGGANRPPLNLHLQVPQPSLSPTENRDLREFVTEAPKFLHIAPARMFPAGS